MDLTQLLKKLKFHFFLFQLIIIYYYKFIITLNSCI